MSGSPYFSSIDDIEREDLDGDKVAVGFRPSGSLHLGNLVTIAYASVLADELDLELDLMVCDTDWSAHIHEHHLPDENRCMKLFFERECDCGGHENVAEHRLDEISEFLNVLKERTVDFEPGFLSDFESQEYTEALRNVLVSMDGFDEIFGGGFRRRYRSPVAAVCDDCCFSSAKGSSYSLESDLMVSACRNHRCEAGFMESGLSEPCKGVYYLVDPVRDPGRGVAVHVFGGDYRDAGKGQKTPKIEKVEKITRLACGETPEYFLAPMLVDEEGNPLSKSHGTGVTVEDIDDLASFTDEMVSKVRELVHESESVLTQRSLENLDGLCDK
jgi:lysyl-tRNA synthetase class I